MDQESKLNLSLTKHKKWKKASETEQEYEKYQKTAYTLIMWHCSMALHAQLKETKGFKKMNSN